MNSFQGAATLLTPVLFGLLAWFIKRHVEKNDEEFVKLTIKIDHLKDSLESVVGRKMLESTSQIRRESSQRQEALVQEQSRLSREVLEMKTLVLDTKRILIENEKKQESHWGKIIFMGESLKKHDDHFKMMAKVLQSFQAELKSSKESP